MDPQLLRSCVAGLALLAFGCSAPSMRPAGDPDAIGGPTSEAPADATGAPAAPDRATAPRPLSPLAPAAPGQKPAAPAIPGPNVGSAPPRGLPDGAKSLDVSVAGDPTRVVLPPGAGDGTRRPALIFMHGHGMDQTQLTTRTSLAEAATREGWIAAAGAFGGRAHWANDEALKAVGALVKALVDQHGADPARIYFVGFSMGGGTALLAAANPLGLPYQVAAVASSQGFSDLKAMTTDAANNGAFASSIAEAYGGSPSETDFREHSPRLQAEHLAGIAVYLEHGEADRSVPVSHMTGMASALTALGQSPEIHAYPAVGHGENGIAEDAIIAFLRGKAR